MIVNKILMAPTHSKPLPEQPLLGTRKRILASSLADPNNVDAAAIKRRKLEEAAAVRRLRQPSIKIVKDDEDDPTVLMHPRKASNILEASDGSNDEPNEFGRGGSSVEPMSEVTYSPEGRRAHEFHCASSHCRGKGANGQIVRRYLNTSDRKSTSNLKCHAITCWGSKTVDDALDAKVDIECA